MQHTPTDKPVGLRVLIACTGLMTTLSLGLAAEASAATLERIQQSGKLMLGYRVDARPFSYQDETGKAAGYSVALCQAVAEQVKAELKLPTLAVGWVPLKAEERFPAVKEGKVDLLCGSDSVTLTRRKDVDFSISTYPSGIGALLRADAPAQLREVLAQGKQSSRPLWRGYPTEMLLGGKTFSAVSGDTSEKWLSERLNTFKLDANVAPVTNYSDGVKRVLDGSSDVFFADLPILLDAAARSSSSGELIVLDRHFTYEPLALALERGDDDFRLIVDRALSGLYKSKGFRDLYVSWFGEPDENVVTFFRQTALPE